MTGRKTWVWVIAGVLAACLILLVAVAGAGVYFVTQHIHADRVSATEALRAFDDIRGRFKGQAPLYEVDADQSARLVRPLADLPSVSQKPTRLCVLGWDPDQQRLVRVVLPLWLLRLGHQKLHVATGDDHAFDLNRLNLDIDDLERIGTALVFDYRNRDGSRVLLWTE
jgi:hypothetical protein